MARKRKTPLQPQPPPVALPTDFDSDSLGSPDSTSSKSGSSRSEKPPLVRNAANARERSRMRVLSKAFSRLKTTLPWVPADTKLSKLDTLRLAACYIAHLREILAQDKVDTTASSSRNTGPIHPLNLTWPFTFNGRVAATNFSGDPISRQKDSLPTLAAKTEITGSS